MENSFFMRSWGQHLRLMWGLPHLRKVGKGEGAKRAPPSSCDSMLMTSSEGFQFSFFFFPLLSSMQVFQHSLSCLVASTFHNSPVLSTKRTPGAITSVPPDGLASRCLCSPCQKKNGMYSFHEHSSWHLSWHATCDLLSSFPVWTNTSWYSHLPWFPPRTLSLFPTGDETPNVKTLFLLSEHMFAVLLT